MKFITTVLFALCTLCLSAQTESYIVLKGHIANNTDSVFEYATPNYLSGHQFAASIDKKGNFLAKIKVETDPQVTLFHLCDGLGLYFEPNDSIDLNWDAKDEKNTITISSPVAIRKIELQAELSEQKMYFPLFTEMLRSLYTEKLSDSAKAVRINALYNKEIHAMMASGVTSNTEKVIMDIYFRYADQMQSCHLLPAYDLVLTDPHPDSLGVFFFKMPGITHAKLYQIESEDFFKHSNAYREFLYNYTRFFTPFKRTTMMGANDEETKNKQLPFTPVWDEYYAGLRSLRLKEIRDWFIAKCIIDGFSFHPYEEVSAVYKDFMARDPSPFYAEALKEAYTKIQLLKPGSPAPLFALKNSQGQEVSLSSFRGKVVLIDFWGVHCGPCIYDIKTHLPALHEKYKDKDIVFLNICVEGTKQEWKDNLDSLHLSGVNVLTTGSVDDPVFKAYNINGIPHYYLIGKDGKIIDNNTPSPSLGVALGEELDKSLK